MKEQDIINFYGFRCNITIENISIYNSSLIDNIISRNNIFRDFFKQLKEKETLETSYEKRKYILLWKDEKESIVHCQIARKRDVVVNKLEGTEINKFEIEDYPYTNIFFDLKSQKLLIESNTDVYSNVATCQKILGNIMSNYFKKIDVIIDIHPITKESEFWDLVKKKPKIYKLSFELNIPNWGNSESIAKELANDTKKLGSDKTKLEINNKDGNINIDEEIIGSFISYISEGAGDWSIKLKDENNNKTTIKSGEKMKIIKTNISKEKIDDVIDNIELEILNNAFNSIEAVESLRR